MITNAPQYNANGLAKFVLRHNVTGLYFIGRYGFSANLDSATRIDERDMTIMETVIRYTWSADFIAIQIGN